MFSRAGKCIGVLGWGLGPRGGGGGNGHFSMPPLGAPFRRGVGRGHSRAIVVPWPFRSLGAAVGVVALVCLWIFLVLGVLRHAIGTVIGDWVCRCVALNVCSPKVRARMFSQFCS